MLISRQTRPIVKASRLILHEIVLFTYTPYQAAKGWLRVTDRD
jgi:hypothetical protein